MVATSNGPPGFNESRNAASVSGPAISLDEVTRFGHHRNRYDKRAFGTGQPGTTALMMTAVSVEQRHQWAGVDDDHRSRGNSLFRISSWCSERSASGAECADQRR
jgi:hypothetical protein